MMRTRSIVATALVGLALSLPASADDVLVWESDGKTGKTHWVRVDGNSARVIATRSQIVLSDGTQLWGLERSTKPLNLYSCEALEGGGDGKADGTFDAPYLVARPLAGGSSVDVVGAPEDSTFYGEVWSQDIRILGGVGTKLMVDRINTGYGCGAHGYDDSYTFVFDVAANKGVEPATFLANEAKFRKKPVADLAKSVEAEECEDGNAAEAIVLDGIEMTLADAPTFYAMYTHPTGADWNFRCTISERTEIPTKALAAAIRPTRAVKAALKGSGVGGTGGYSVLKLGGNARERALAAFKRQPIPAAPKRNRANADAKPHVNRGRKLTKEKKYDEAIAAFSTAIRKDPQAARAWSGRGYARLLAGKLKLAARDFDHALTLDQTDDYRAAIFYNLGLVSEKQGKLKQAVRAFKKAKALKPGKKAYDKAIRRVKKAMK